MVSMSMFNLEAFVKGEYCELGPASLVSVSKHAGTSLSGSHVHLYAASECGFILPGYPHS